MEEKRRETAAHPPSNSDSPASELMSSRRRAGGQKRKASALNSSNSSSTSSKRIIREKALPAHSPPHHNGPLTRARQIPTNLAASSPAFGAGFASAPAAVRHSESTAPAEALDGDSAALAEEPNKDSGLEFQEAAIETEFEAIRSRDANAHVVPSHCGWFSWTDIHPIEQCTLPSFFNGKTESRTPHIYMEIRNWVMKKFHANPNLQIEVKDLSELDVGDLDARQEVMEFLDYWGLINFHPFPSMVSAVASTGNDEEAENNSLLEKLYRFEIHQLCPPIPKTSLMTPAMTSGLLPESTIAEDLVKLEGSAVEFLEYHCNSCSADCSRKRYHCQKQADFDLCTDCFSNRRFGSGMSSLDFILMEPGEVPGVSGEKWTDQETLLLLEALELYKENWNEIAEHVGTKSKAQCILHFVQMPIEDAFIDYGDDDDPGCKEADDPSAVNNDSSVHKGASEFVDIKTDGGVEDHMQTPHNETSGTEDVNKVKVNQETPKLEDGSDEKTSEGTSKSEDAIEVKLGQEAGNDVALNALKEAFAAVGYSHGPESLSSLAEVGNPVMALAVFLARLVGSDMAVASAHSSLKSLSENSPGIELAARHCFLLEHPPDNKELTSSERNSKEGARVERDVKQDKPMLDVKDLSNVDSNKKIGNDALEDKRQLGSADDGASGKPIPSEEQTMNNHDECGLDKCNDPSYRKLLNGQTPSMLHDSGGSTTKDELPLSSGELRDGTLVKEPGQPVEELKDGHVVSDSLPSENNELRQSIKSSLVGKYAQPVETPKDTEMVCNSVPLNKSKPEKPLSTNPVGESLETTNLVMDNSLPSEKTDSQSLFSSISSQHTGTEKDLDMMSSSVPLDKNSPSDPARSNSGAENGAITGKDNLENDPDLKDDIKETKQDNNFEKVKCAAISTLAAAAVKAKLLANQEEIQIWQLASLMIEKQLHKLETKLAFFSDVDNVVMRAKEHLDWSRQKLYHERALIIASRLGLPALASRGLPPSLPTNRIPMNFSNSVPRSQIIMNPQRPPNFRSVGTIATNFPSPLASATAAGNSVQPSSQ